MISSLEGRVCGGWVGEFVGVGCEVGDGVADGRRVGAELRVGLVCCVAAAHPARVIPRPARISALRPASKCILLR